MARQTESHVKSPMQASIEARDSGKATSDDAPAMPVESKAAKFKRLINRRLPQLEKALVRVQALANKRQYERTEGQQEAVLRRLKLAYDSAVASYSGGPTAAPADEI